MFDLLLGTAWLGLFTGCLGLVLLVFWCYGVCCYGDLCFEWFVDFVGFGWLFGFDLVVWECSWLTWFACLGCLLLWLLFGDVACGFMCLACLVFVLCLLR